MIKIEFGDEEIIHMFAIDLINSMDYETDYCISEQLYAQMLGSSIEWFDKGFHKGLGR